MYDEGTPPLGGISQTTQFFILIETMLIKRHDMLVSAALRNIQGIFF